jgi:predicted RNA methylase
MYMKAFEASSDYFRVKAFKNGNLHVWFLRDDLVEKVNQLLADYYGAALGDASEDARAEAKTASAFRRDLAPAKNFGFFPTPAKLAQDVIESADIRADDRVLEPNAGTGALASLAAAKGAAVTCVEIQPRLISELEQDPRYTVVMAMDFLELSPEQTGEFDKIVMNPPFDRGLDVLHVNHALNFLAPGGTLVAIMSAGAEFKTDAKSTAFRQKIERMRGHFRDLPNGSFAEVGTMVNTVMLTVTKR